MTAFDGVEYRYFSIDSADDLSVATLLIGLTPATATIAATYISSPPPRLTAITPLPAAGMTRYWWRHLCGQGTDLPLVYGFNAVYGLLTDSPEIIPCEWTFILSR